MHDIVIIGGGPAGMTAALYAVRNGKSALVLEKGGFGGQITYSPRVENYPGSLSMSGNEFADKMLEQILAQGAEVEVETVTGIAEEGGYKRVLTESGTTFDAKAVVIATGVKHRMLGLSGENELVGNGISFCALCDGEYYKGLTVAVAGGGNSALQEATLLADVCREVVMIQDLDFFTGEEMLVKALLKRPNVRAFTGTAIEEIKTEEAGFAGLKLRKKATDETFELPCDGLFVAIGLIPENGAFSELVPLDKAGYIASGEDCETGHSGIFVAGDCRSKRVRQLTTATADGAVAALAACESINKNF
ncbi:MAG: thioredoxin-disulfide reductase [Firmicutes bacterium HGW-Firmicutes-16]|nr:MAG: thioredoxin-disulfide reductase [Firmicutes bacterium HGW-Firmicutes-16]